MYKRQFLKENAVANDFNRAFQKLFETIMQDGEINDTPLDTSILSLKSYFIEALTKLDYPFTGKQRQEFRKALMKHFKK